MSMGIETDPMILYVIVFVGVMEAMVSGCRYQMRTRLLRMFGDVELK
jgi:hypothetical protein